MLHAESAKQSKAEYNGVVAEVKVAGYHMIDSFEVEHPGGTLGVVGHQEVDNDAGDESRAGKGVFDGVALEVVVDPGLEYFNFFVLEDLVAARAGGSVGELESCTVLHSDQFRSRPAARCREQEHHTDFSNQNYDCVGCQLEFSSFSKFSNFDLLKSMLQQKTQRYEGAGSGNDDKKGYDSPESYVGDRAEVCLKEDVGHRPLQESHGEAEDFSLYDGGEGWLFGGNGGIARFGGVLFFLSG